MVALPATIEAFNQLVSAYQDKFMDLDLYNDTYDLFCSLVEKSYAKVFEVGCGPGNITRYLLSKKPGLRIEAIDMAPNMISLASANNPSAIFKVMDCKNIGSLSPGFDGVMCGFCMPYLSKEECATLIKDCGSLLNEGGIFYCSVIEDSYAKSGIETSSSGEHSVHVYYHEEDYLCAMLKENGFNVVHLLRKTYPKPDGKIDTHLILVSKKQHGRATD